MIRQLNTSFGRYYDCPGGIFPSVTTVLASIPNPSLQEWRNKIGDEAADKVSKNACAIGNRLHKYCEDYLNKMTPKLDVFDKQAFYGIDKHLKLIVPYAIEKRFWSSKIKSAGTIDVVGKYDGKLSIIDFKTTSKDKFPGEFDNYWLQLAAYCFMIYERTGTQIDQLVIIMQNTSGETTIFKEYPDKWLREYVKIRNNFDDKSHLIVLE